MFNVTVQSSTGFESNIWKADRQFVPSGSEQNWHIWSTNKQNVKFGEIHKVSDAIDGCCWRECFSHILTIVCADGGCRCNNGILCCPLYWVEGVLSRYPVVPFSGLSSSFQVGVIIRRLRLPGRSGRHWCGAGSRSETLETSWKTRPLLLLLRDTRFPKRRQQQHWVFWRYLWTSWEVVLGWSGRGGLGWSPHRSRSVELSLKNFPHISLFCNTVHLSRFLPGSSSPLPENIWRMSLNIGQGAARVASWDWTQSTWTRPARDAEGGGGQPGSVGNGTLIENDGGEVDVSLFTAYRPSSKT